ncbi:unnamed protein product [Miscanthus lutarioriparius]|uniref:Uncharacterized protein n=1 Tax=Miscanthus lutarioriparius TaxID=422564 RepID=A0A811PAH6_9POAL|nr:unnamed protein product [Miscanthus lutarioriparius]
MATTAAAALSMKLLIDRKARRELFAEATKEVMDFLFSLLALPVATAVKLVGKEAMVGCVGNLYASVDKLDSTYVQADAAKDALLCPTVLSPAASTNSSLLHLPEKSPVQPKTFYSSSGQVVAQSAAKGFAQGIVTYTVLDDLTVTPMSAISSITLLNTFAVRDLGDLQEKNVQLSYNEVDHCTAGSFINAFISIVVGF